MPDAAADAGVGQGAPTVCGIDYGSAASPSYIAWLAHGRIVFDLYAPAPGALLPPPPRGTGPAAVYAFDAPQGLGAAGESRRLCDALARTPTQRLPQTRDEMAAWRLYGPFVRGGVDLFWQLHDTGAGHVLDLGPDGRALPPGPSPSPSSLPLVCETYPRRVLCRLFGLAPGDIPSKRKQAVRYVHTVWPLVLALGIEADGVRHPCVDQVDAALCALAARALAGSLAQGNLPAGTVGRPPRVDPGEALLREGWLVSP